MKFGPYTFSGDAFPVIAGPCVIESERHVLKMAHLLAEVRDRLGLQLVFKTSFDKANRTSSRSYRGISLEAALPIFRWIREEFGLPLLTDVHTPDQPDKALSDSGTQWPFEHFESLMADLLAFRETYVEVRHRD